MNKENEKKRKVRLVPLSSDATLSQRTAIEMFSGSGSTPEKASTPVGVGDEGSTKESASAWSSPLVVKPTSAEETVKAASSTEKSNTAPGTPSQNPPKSSDNGSTSEWRPGKNYERNQRRKQRKKLLKGLKGLDLNNPGGDFQASNSGSTKRPRESSGSLTTPTNPKQKRGRIESEHVEQRGTKRAEEAGPSNLASYARAVKTSNQKLVITRKGSKGEAPMVESDLRVIQGAINQMILKTKLDFSVRNIGSGIILVQEPWTYGGAIRSKPRGWKLFQGNEKDKRPRACIYVTSDMTCSLIPQFSSKDVVAVRVKSVRREGDSFIFVSAYMAMEEPAPPEILKELLSFSDRDNIPTVIGTDTNAHHTVWGSSNVNSRGMDLLTYCASSNLYFCNVGNKPTFRTRKREEVLDLTLMNRNAVNCIRDWHVSDVPSFSDHMYIRFRIQMSTKKAKMIRNVRRTCWSKYASELDQRLHDLNSKPVNISSVEDIERLASTVQSEIIKSYNASCPQRKIRRKTQNTWWNTEVNGLRREARRAHRKAIKSKLEKDWEAFRQAQTIYKKAVRKAKRDSWRLFTESMKSQSAIARLTKVVGHNETVQISNVLRPDGKFTESAGETIDCLLDILAPGSREVSCSKTADEPNKNTVSITDVEIVNSICSLEKMEKAINEFQPFKAPGPDGIYPVLLQKG